jgi:hypothetical protein
MKRGLIIVSTTLFVFGCDNSHEAQREKFDKFVVKNRVGSSSDSWLIKVGAFGPEKVALIFGFTDDQSFCREIAELYMKKHPMDTYRCELGN